MKNTLILLSAAAIALSGCASPAKIENMTIQKNQLVNVASNSKFYNSISHVVVDGGKDTNPLWTSQVSSESFESALIESLRQANLWSYTKKYSLQTNLISLKQPIVGFNMTVRASVDYKVKDETTGTVIFDEKIDSAYTATVGDAFAGFERLRIANEGAIRNNIELFLKKLSEK